MEAFNNATGIWHIPDKNKIIMKVILSLCRKYQNNHLQTYTKSHWPTVDKIRISQKEHDNTPSSGCIRNILTCRAEGCSRNFSALAVPLQSEATGGVYLFVSAVVRCDSFRKPGRLSSLFKYLPIFHFWLINDAHNCISFASQKGLYSFFLLIICF